MVVDDKALMRSGFKLNLNAAEDIEVSTAPQTRSERPAMAAVAGFRAGTRR